MIKNSQMHLLKETRAQGKIAFFRHTKLIIRERIAEDDTAGRGQRLPGAAVAVAGSRPSSEAGVGTAATPGAAPRTTDGDQVGSGLGASGDGGVVAVEAHGVWCGRVEEDSPSLSLPRLVGSRGQLPSTPVAPQQLRSPKTRRGTRK